jgi:hypothetical protein
MERRVGGRLRWQPRLRPAVTGTVGPKLAFAFTVSGDTLTGTVILTMNGSGRTFKLSAKRATTPDGL